MADPPISVLLFSNSIARGGAEEHMLTLLRNLDRSLFQPFLACMPAVAEKLGADLPQDIEVVPVVLRRPADVAGAWQLGKFIVDRKIDILHSHLFYSSLFASPIGWMRHMPVVIETPHLREQWRHGWKASYWIDRTIGHFVDQYVAVSSANARYLIEQKRLPACKVTVVRNGTDPDRFHPHHTPPAGMRTALGFGSDDPVLLVAARLEPQKGHTILLDALPLVRREFPAVRLVCIGEGALKSQLQEKTERQQLQDAVRWVGFQPNVEDWLALATMTVLPSLFEGLPITAIESLAAGRPMVATAVDGTPEVVIDGQTGVLVPAGDAVRLAEGIVKLLRDEPMRQRLASSGRALVLNHFTHKKQVGQTQQLYLNLLRRKGVRVPSYEGSELEVQCGHR
jgi:glycosyltransferase involved in cell wall biosynthesis